MWCVWVCVWVFSPCLQQTMICVLWNDECSLKEALLLNKKGFLNSRMEGDKEIENLLYDFLWREEYSWEVEQVSKLEFRSSLGYPAPKHLHSF